MTMTRDSGPRRTLRGKFLRVTGPLIFLSVTVSIIILEVITYRASNARLEKVVDNLVVGMSLSLANPVWNLDYEQLRLSLQAAVASSVILEAAVRSEDGQVMASAGSVPEDTPGGVIRRSHEITYDAGDGPHALGTIELAASRELVWHQTLLRVLFGAVIALVAVAAEVGAALYAFRKIVTKPLAHLLDSINQVRRGEERQRVDWESSDELGQVIDAYNEMQAQQQAYEHDLRDARDTLEERVRERTAELAVARDESERAWARLDDAINATSEGFSIFDSDDRIVIVNKPYQEVVHSDVDWVVVPGQHFETIIRRAVENGFFLDARADPETWLAQRIERHRNPGEPHLQPLADGRWLRISERRTHDGGIVTVISDITELKQREQELATKSAQLEQLSNQLSKYLSPQVYHSIFEGRQEVKIDASRKKLTVFFSDIVDFTETTDRMESEEITQLLNHYLTEMSQIALKYGATIDKYVGDAIVIFFGDPETRGVRDDALACVRMAIAMRGRLSELEGTWRAAGIARPLRCRMGIHTDFCTVGNFGSEDRLDYTIIGRGVNTAARLEGLAKPDTILISYETYAHVAAEIDCVKKGEFEVKGLAYAISTYEVVGERGTDIAQPSALATLSAIAAKNPALMSEGERAEAISALEAALAQLSSDEAPPSGPEHGSRRDRDQASSPVTIASPLVSRKQND